MDNVIIQVSNFHKAYQQEIAVEDLSFHVESGQVLGLIGPNGAGKTTTLRAIAGIIPASDGELSVCDYEVSSDPISLKRNTAYVPDDPQLFNDLTVEQHFAFTASIYQVDDWQEKMTQILKRFELFRKLKARASDLSRGMRQKLAIGCAYLYQPKALLLDEPMTGLDPKGIRALKNSITQRAEAGDAVVISSHLLAMVEDICTNVLILESGDRMFFGSLAELKDQYADQIGDGTLEEIFLSAVGNADQI